MLKKAVLRIWPDACSKGNKAWQEGGGVALTNLWVTGFRTLQRGNALI